VRSKSQTCNGVMGFLTTLTVNFLPITPGAPESPSFFLWLAQKAIWGQKSTKKLIQEIEIRFIEPPRVFWRAKP
jgi:hypothetical protein